MGGTEKDPVGMALKSLCHLHFWEHPPLFFFCQGLTTSSHGTTKQLSWNQGMPEMAWYDLGGDAVSSQPHDRVTTLELFSINKSIKMFIHQKVENQAT